jgi:hypothetical protein
VLLHCSPGSVTRTFDLQPLCARGLRPQMGFAVGTVGTSITKSLKVVLPLLGVPILGGTLDAMVQGLERLPAFRRKVPRASRLPANPQPEHFRISKRKSRIHWHPSGGPFSLCWMT